MEFQTAAILQIDGRAGPRTQQALKNWPETKSNKVQSTINAEVVYRNQHAKRNRPCTPQLELALGSAVAAVYGPGMQVQIYSGGQARLGTSGQRTGSIRHDDYGLGGRAADVWVFDKSGTKLQGLELARLGQYWLAKKIGGVGLEMAVGGIHLDEWSVPPPKGGMYWFYPYALKQKWAKRMQAMLVAGSRGEMPPVFSDS
jgi:hypothetical protein